MAKLSLWLPPFSPDYSGAAAVLFDLKTVTAMHDGSGCTGNYTGYDEPRWYGSKSGIYCSGLREIDAVLGNDEKLIQKMCYAAEDIKPELLALIGSPVPMVIGSDLSGIAKDLESRTGIPSIGLDTTGTAYYDKGAFWTACQLLDKFAKPMEAEDRRVNILGVLPMDFYKGEDPALLKKRLEQEGYRVGITFAMDYTLEQLKHVGKAQVNIAVSRFGYLMAVYMEKKYGIPYLCGFPAGKKTEKIWLAELEKVREEKRSAVFGIRDRKKESAEAGILIIGEQVMGNAIRTALGTEFGIENITVGCLYGKEEELSGPGDCDLTDERMIKEEMNSGNYVCIIADPFLQCLKRNDEIIFIPCSQYAVSSKLGVGDQVLLLGDRFNQWYEKKRGGI